MPNRNGHRRGPRGAIPHATLEELVDQGLSVRAIADEVDRSPTTVRYWLKKYGLTLRNRGPRRLHGVRGGTAARITSHCEKHGETAFALRTDGYYRCLRCCTEAVQRWRRNARRRLVEEAGGRCVVCGFSELAALEFHHRDRDQKEFGLAARGITRSFEALKREAAKCVLLCSNCHAQVEAGMLALPEP